MAKSRNTPTPAASVATMAAAVQAAVAAMPAELVALAVESANKAAAEAATRGAALWGRAAYAVSPQGQAGMVEESRLRKQLADAQREAEEAAHPTPPRPPPVPAAVAMQSQSEQRQQSLRAQVEYAGSKEGQHNIREEARLRKELAEAQARAAPPSRPESAGVGRGIGGALSAAAAVGATLGGGPVAGLASAAVSAAMGNLAGAAVGAAGALKGLAHAGAPDAAQTLDDSFTLISATIGKDLVPTMMQMSQAAQGFAKWYEQSYLRQGLQAATARPQIVEDAMRRAWSQVTTDPFPGFGTPMLSQTRRSQTMGPEQYMDQLLTAGLQQGDLQTAILQQQLQALSLMSSGIDKVVENTARRFGLDSRPFG
jgi:hypothetical protein